jgi:hypothetical protein
MSWKVWKECYSVDVVSVRTCHVCFTEFVEVSQVMWQIRSDSAVNELCLRKCMLWMFSSSPLQLP